jgi:ribonuclease HII
MNKEKELFLKKKLRIMKEYEKALYEKGIRFIAGIDEAGRGPLAGPVVAAAVILPEDFDVLGIDDSKKLSEKKRDLFYEVIRQKAVAFSIGTADHATIDSINILQATKAAMKEAVQGLEAICTVEHLLLDAVLLNGVTIPQTSIIKGDTKSLSIAAASILAKVTRDRMMKDFHRLYPAYGFDHNKGYGTKFHFESIESHGICRIHRISFLKKKYGAKYLDLQLDVGEAPR